MPELPRRLLVLGLCRNSAATLPALLGMFHEIMRSGALDLQVLLGENGSTDATREILEQAAAANSWLNIIDTGFMSYMPERLTRMAAGREALRKSLPPPLPGDAVLVLDTDLDLIWPLSVDSLQAALRELEQPMTNGICSYSLPLHYDILALRETAQSRSPGTELHLASLGPRSFWVRLRRYPRKLLNTLRITRQQHKLGVASGRAFVSAFNGLCLYPRPLYDAVSYLAPGIECEHVVLHLAMHRKTGGMIRVSQHLGVRAPQEHIASFARQITGPLRRFAPGSFQHSEAK